MEISNSLIKRIYKQVDLESGLRVVLIDVYGLDYDEGRNQEVRYNIFCVDHDMNKVWQVCEDGVSHFSDGDPFVYIGEDDDGNLIADRFSGFEYIIDQKTGVATRTGFHK